MPPKKSPPPRTSKRNAQFENRCQRFVEAAEQLFMKNGFAGTSVNEVVRIAGGSLATLYAEYPTKEALFEAVMSGRCARLFDNARENGNPSLEIRAELIALARRMLDRALSDDALAIYRLAVHEGPKFPSVRNAVLVKGLRAYLGRLAAHLSELAAAGKLRLDDPLIAAEDFLTLVHGQHRTAAAFGAERLTAAERKAHAAHAVKIFLSAYGVADDGASHTSAKRAARKAK
jgi:AcrR family transcriptional regulator